MTIAGCQIKCRITIKVAFIQAGPFIQQGNNDIRAPTSGGPMESRIAIMMSLYIRISTVGQQKLDDFQRSNKGSSNQRSRPVNGSAFDQQGFDHITVPIDSGQVKGQMAVLTSRIRVNPLGQQVIDSFQMS